MFQNIIGSLLFHKEHLIGILQDMNTKQHFSRFINVAVNAPLIQATLDCGV